MAVEEDAPPASRPRLTEKAVEGGPLCTTVTAQLDSGELARIDALAQERSTASHAVSREEMIERLIDVGLDTCARQGGRHLTLVKG